MHRCVSRSYQQLKLTAEVNILTKQHFGGGVGERHRISAVIILQGDIFLDKINIHPFEMLYDDGSPCGRVTERALHWVYEHVPGAMMGLQLFVLIKGQVEAQKRFDPIHIHAAEDRALGSFRLVMKLRPQRQSHLSQPIGDRDLLRAQSNVQS